MEICLHQLNVTIHLLNSPNTTLTVFEAVLFASNELTIEYEFQRNAEYVAVVRYVGSGNQLSFSFSEYHSTILCNCSGVYNYMAVSI